jgi:hypothetical protein
MAEVSKKRFEVKKVRSRPSRLLPFHTAASSVPCIIPCFLLNLQVACPPRNVLAVERRGGVVVVHLH